MTNECTEPTEGGHEFEIWESNFFQLVKPLLLCNNPNCREKPPNISSHGRGGNKNQFDAALLQIECKNCSTRTRLLPRLEYLAEQNPEHAAYAAKYKAVHEAQPLKTKKTKTSTVKASKPLKPISHFFLPPALPIPPAQSPVEQQLQDTEAATEVDDNMDFEESHVEVETSSSNQISILTAQNAELRKTNSQLIRLVQSMEAIQQQNHEFMRTLQEQILSLTARLATIEKKSPSETLAPPAQVTPMSPAPATAQVSDPTPAESNTFASVLKKDGPPPSGKRKAWKKVSVKEAAKIFAPRPPPATFSKIYLKIEDNRRFATARAKGNLRAVAYSALMALGVGRQVVEFSFIGKSILELYVADPQVDSVLDKLKEKKLTVLEDFNIEANPNYGKSTDTQERVVRRLAFLYKRARFHNLKECIVEGISETTKEAIINLAMAEPPHEPTPQADMQVDEVAAIELQPQEEVIAVPVSQASAVSPESESQNTVTQC